MRDLVVLRSSGETNAAPDLESFVARVAERLDDDRNGPAVLDLPHPSADARSRFGRTFPIEIDALAWLPVGASLPGPWAEHYEESFRYTTRPHVGWAAPAEHDASPTDVVKQVSFLHGADGYDLDAFRSHYRDHVGIAGKYMPALWQYVQNDVEAIHGDGPGAKGVLAISELWFRTTDDFLHRYFPSEEDQRAFSSHEGFLDLRFATSFICVSARGPSTPGGG